MSEELFINAGGRRAGLMVGRRGLQGRPSVLFVHGSGGTAQSWLAQVNPLDREIGAAALDLPGRGGTPGPPINDVRQMGAFINQAVLALNLDQPPVLAGMSMGGAAALAAALQNQALWSGLILISTSPVFEPREDLISTLEKDHQAGARMFADMLSRNERDAIMASQTRDALAMLPAETLRADLEAPAGFNMENRLREITLPTLIMVGGADPLTPPDLSRRLAHGLPNSRLVVIEGAGHLLTFQAWKEVNEKVIGFVKELLDPDQHR